MPSVEHPPKIPTGRAPHPVWSGVVSVLFWLFLLTAAGLYAGVSLAPKIVVWREWDRQYQANQMDLVSLETRNGQLEQVVAVLKDDPQFAAEVVRLEFDAQMPGEEVIPVSDSLALNPRAKEAESPPLTVRAEPWDPWLSALATQQPLRQLLLAIAAGLVIVGFTFLHDHRSQRGPSVLSALRERYQNR
ncbi:MAG: septum formation initiator family protein [Planctomycetaceae bacterium]|nr:septum formation initiator family protein [Planctomycetaceae bacterium]